MKISHHTLSKRLPAQNQPTTEWLLRPLKDLLIMAGFEPSKTVTFKVFVNPLVFWMWMGGLVMVMERSLPLAKRRPTGQSCNILDKW
jgi:cytochrome c biogenesis factor